MNRNLISVCIMASLSLIGCKSEVSDNQSAEPTTGTTMSMNELVQNGSYAATAEWYTNVNPLTDHGDGSYTLNFLSEPEQGYARFRRQDGGHVDLTKYVNGSISVDLNVVDWGDAGAGNSYVKIFMGNEAVPADAPFKLSNSELTSLDTWYRCTLPVNLTTTYDELAGTDDNGLSPWDLMSFGADYSNMNNMKYSFKNIVFSQESPADPSGPACVATGDGSALPAADNSIPNLPTDGVSMSQLLSDGYYTNFTSDWGSYNLSSGDLTTGKIDVDFSGETSNGVARFDTRGMNFGFSGYGDGSLFIDITVNSYGTKNDDTPHDNAFTPYVKIFINDENSPGFVEIHDTDPANLDSVNWDDRVAVGTKNRCIVPLKLITSEIQLTDSDGDGSNLAPWNFISFSGNFENLKGMKYSVENIYFSPSSPSLLGGNNDGVKCYR